jgi:hypothetical protein
VLLKDSRCDPSDCYNNAICFAAANGHGNVTKLLLLDCRVDPFVKDNFAVRHATQKGFNDIVDMINSRIAVS